MQGLLLLMLWWLAAPLASTLFGVFALWVRYDDRSDGPSGADWVRSQAAATGLEIEVHRGPTGFDAFVPETGVLVLGASTFDRSHPLSRAIAAHELGHAWLYLNQPWLGRLLLVARVLGGRSTRVAAALLITALLFGSAAPREMVLLVLPVSIGLGALVLVDELVASGRALATLRGGEALGWAVVGLGLAFATYLGWVGANVALWVGFEGFWALLPEVTVSSDRVGPGLFGTLVLGVCTLVLAWRLLLVGMALVLRDATALAVGDLQTLFAVSVFVWLTFPVVDGPLAHLFLAGAMYTLIEVFWMGVAAVVLLLGAPLAWSRELRRLLSWVQEVAEARGMVALVQYDSSVLIRVFTTVFALAWLPWVLWYWLAS